MFLIKTKGLLYPGELEIWWAYIWVGIYPGCLKTRILQYSTMTWQLGVRTAPEKPWNVLVAIQTDKSGKQDHNESLFDHGNVVNMIVALNSIKYPPLAANANFTKYQFVQFYKYMTEFTLDYYGMDPLVSGSAIHPLTYKELITLFVFNVSKQSEHFNHEVVEKQFSEFCSEYKSLCSPYKW